MKKVCEEKKTPLDAEERNLLSVAFKNVVGARRESWSKVYTLESKEKTRMEALKEKGQKDLATQHELQTKYCQDYRRTIETELTSICREVLTLLTDKLIPVENEGAAAYVDIISDAEKYKERGMDTLEKDLSKRINEVEEKKQVLTKITSGESLVFYFKM